MNENLTVISLNSSTTRNKISEDKPAASTSVRAPWNGGLSVDELARPGGAFLGALLHRANQIGHQLNEMSAELNVTYGYIAQLRSGTRQCSNISDDFVNACAAYLDVPRMTVLLLCGRVRPDDVLHHKHNMAQQIPAAMDFIAADPVFGPLMPIEVRNTSYELQYFVVCMYEKATNKVLLSGRQDPVALAHDLKEVLAQAAALNAEVEVSRQAKRKA
jgi:hypothetical protein